MMKTCGESNPTNWFYSIFVFYLGLLYKEPTYTRPKNLMNLTNSIQLETVTEKLSISDIFVITKNPELGSWYH